MIVIKEKYLLNVIDTLTFKVISSAYYLIKISARAKSEKQRKSTDDEEITIKIDNQIFPKLDTKGSLKNSPASFNGGKLHNKEQIIYFVMYLDKGNHILELQPQYGDGAEVTQVGYEAINIEIENQLTLNLNTKLEDRDKQPWITFVLVNTGIKSLNMETFVNWHWLDGDDIKVIVNGETQKAKTTLRKDWIIKTNVLNIFGKTETIRLTLNLPVQPHHYIELYADKIPTLKNISFELSNKSGDTKVIQKYKDEKFRRDYNRLDQSILDAVNYWNDFFSRQQYPPIQLLDPAQPTLLGKTPESEFIDTNTVEFIHNTYPSNVVPDVSTSEESIFWGVRWLYHKAQFLSDLIKPYRREWRTWENAIYNYNASDNVEEYVKEVFSIYKNGVDLEGNVLWEN